MIRSSISSAQEEFEIEDFRVESDVLKDSLRVCCSFKVLLLPQYGLGTALVPLTSSRIWL